MLLQNFIKNIRLFYFVINKELAMATIQIKINLTQHQISKLKHAKKNKKSVTLHFKNEQLSFMGKHTIDITPMQYKKVLSAQKSKARRGIQLTFSHAQIGGFLGALLAAVAPTLIKGVANLVQKKSFFAGDGMCRTKKKRGNGLFLPGMKERYRR